MIPSTAEDPTVFLAPSTSVLLPTMLHCLYFSLVHVLNCEVRCLAQRNTSRVEALTYVNRKHERQYDFVNLVAYSLRLCRVQLLGLVMSEDEVYCLIDALGFASAAGASRSTCV